MKRKFRFLVSFLLIFVLVASCINYGERALATTDATSKLKNIKLSVTQAGKEITSSDTIDSKQPISIAIEFQVPVVGDGVADGTEYVNKGEVASFVISKGFSLASGAGPFELIKDSMKVGTLFIEKNASNDLIATIEFDGDEDLFTSQIDNWSDVFCTFNATLQYSDDADAGAEGNHTVYLLDKTYTVNVAPLPVVINGVKTGNRSGQYINWKVKVDANKGTLPGDMSGYVFSDNLSNVGTYVPASFMVSSVDNVATATSLTSDFSQDVTNLTYTFPSDTSGTQYIFYQTRIKDSAFYSNKNETITNQVKIMNGTEQAWSGSATVSFVSEWIKKEATAINHETGEVTWKITANQLGASLPNAVITDILDSRLEFDTAKWSKWNATTGNWISTQAITPTDNSSKYSFGDVDSPILLEITTKVKKSEYNIGHEIQTIANKAKIEWDGRTGIESGQISVNIGTNPIDKTVGSGGYNSSTHAIPWKVSVRESDINVDLRVLDLLVYGTSFDKNKTYTITDNAASGLEQITANDMKELEASFNQKYGGNFASPDGLIPTVYTVKDDNGKAVADLIVVTSASGAGITVTTNKQEFSYNSIVTNPDIYASNGSKDVTNTAVLFSANTRLNSDKATASCSSSMLKKELLSVADAKQPDNNKNATGATQGYNYIDQSIVYRLVVNANDIKDVTNDVTTVSGTTLGSVNLTDTLPSGWEFVDITSGKKFLIYDGTKSLDGKISAGDISENTIVTSDFTTQGKAIFEFNSLTRPYVILLKAQPQSTLVKDYFSGNKTTTVRNQLKLSTLNWAKGVSINKDASIKSEVLSKNYSKSDAELVWTVDYKPYRIEHEANRIEDTLPLGLELKTDSKGKLNLENDNMKAYELELDSDGTYSPKSSVLLEDGKNIGYDSISRKLSFFTPDPAKGYRLVYKTDITGDSGESLTNSVRVVGASLLSTNLNKNYTVSSADVSASMTKSGWIEITKQDEKQVALSGATFELLTEDKSMVLRTGTTGANGKLALRGLPIGVYWLTESIAPADYNLPEKIYQVHVVKEDGIVSTSISGITGSNSNKITIENIKTNMYGALRITKILNGKSTDSTKEFNFNIQFDSLDGDFKYTGAGGRSDGSISFHNGSADLKLKGGESITILLLPKNISYVVTEEDYASEGYVTTKSGDSGTIGADQLLEAKFINTKEDKGDITPIIPTSPGVLETPTMPTPTESVTPTIPVTPTVPVKPSVTVTPTMPVKPSVPIAPDDSSKPSEDKPDNKTNKKTTDNKTAVNGIVEVPKDGIVSVYEKPEHGTVTIDHSGKWVYTPDSSYVGTDRFKIRTIDERGEEKEFYIDIKVQDTPAGTIELPKTGEPQSYIFYIMGLTLILMGTVVYGKMKRVHSRK